MTEIDTSAAAIIVSFTGALVCGLICMGLCARDMVTREFCSDNVIYVTAVLCFALMAVVLVLGFTSPGAVKPAAKESCEHGT